PAPLAAAGPAPAPSLAPGCSGKFPKSARVAEALAAHRPLHIGVFGDSFGDGLWAATDQAFRKYPDVKVHQFSHEGTGFTRYRTRDLLQDAKDRVAGQPIDVALISIGANDTQGLFVNGHAAAYMTPAWQETIEGRMTALVRMLQQRGVAVGWVGLPRMRDATYDRDIQAMNRFYAKVTCRLGVPFANAVPVSQDRQGHFALRLIDPATGKDYLARANDGKHMTFHGYEVISRPVVQPILALLAPPAAKPTTQAVSNDTAPAASASHAPAPKHAKRPAVDATRADVPSKPTGLPTDLPTHKSTASPTDLSTAPAKAPADAKPAPPAPTPSASPSKSSAGASPASGKRS
ncbi:GDSL-type esterase/lipase family protein, partial [Novosphingobium sp. B-7]|uniref:DUF459 domain-containing protein n=1 Tax=Novosphingobium sp. B-7 TaxID=1298855 RepID=UPI0009E466FD